MTITEYEKRIQAVNPKLRIKRYGTSMAAVHYGNEHVCRVPQGDIWEYNEFQSRIGFADQYITPFNMKGEYRWRQLTKRGRAEVARILYTRRLIPADAISKLS